jgi:hypothetical protein
MNYCKTLGDTPVEQELWHGPGTMRWQPPCGPTAPLSPPPLLSCTDIQLACLAGPLLCVPNELSTTWLPQLDLLPPNLRTFVQVMIDITQ